MSKILSNPKVGTFGDTAVTQYPLSYANDRFIVPIRSNASIGYSTNGLYNWQFSDKGTDGNKFACNNPIYCNGVYIIPCYGKRYGQVAAFITNYYFYSTDGVTWEQKQLSSNLHWLGATNGNEFLLIGHNMSLDSTVLYQSTNGIDWTDITSKATFTEYAGYPVDVIYNDQDETYCILFTDTKARTDVLTLCCGTSNSFATIEVPVQLNITVRLDYSRLVMAGENIVYYDASYPYYYEMGAKEKYLEVEWDQIALESTANYICISYNPGFLLISYQQSKTVGTGTTTGQSIIYIEDGSDTQKTIWNTNTNVPKIIAIASNNNSRFVLTTDSSTKLYAIDVIDEVETTPHRLFRYQDIQNTDRATWLDYIAKIQSGDFAGAQTAVKDITDKQLTATQLNDLFNFIVEMQNISDPTFKSDVIKTSSTAPAGLVVGKMYFKEYV